MHTPYYFRSPEYRYCLGSEGAYGWWTGTIAGGRQVFRGPTAFIVFDEQGHLLRAEDSSRYPVPREWQNFRQPPSQASTAWLTELDFKECPIRVLRFWLPEFWVGIEDMPDELAEFYTAPGSFELEPSDVQAWINTDQYVFHAGCGDYFISRAGEVETS
jgi:hypothetical protein